MRASILLAFLTTVAIFAAPQEALAEQKVKANQSTKVFARRGEQAKVIVTLDKGASMKLLKTQGRWVQVRVKGRTGWVPRTVLDMPEEEVSRNTRRRPFVDGRGTKRGFGGEEGPDDRVGADAVGEGETGGEDEEEEEEGEDDPPTKPTKPTKPAKAEKPTKTVATKPTKSEPEDEEIEDEEEDPSGEGKPEEEEDTGPPRKTVRVASKTSIFSEADGEADVEFSADAKMPLYPTGNTEGKYTEVENDEGDIGWVLSSEIEVEEDLGEGEEEEESPSGPRRRHIDVKARLGVTIMQQGMRTAGGGNGLPNNYNLSTSAATLALGGNLLLPFKERLVIGGELGFDAAFNTGITIMAGAKPTKLQLYNLGLRGVIGYDLRRKSGMMVFGRLGLRYESFQVSNVTDLAATGANAGKIPSEIVIAPTLGAALTLPRLTEKFGVRFSVDAVVAGASVSQTKRLEDGANPTAKGAIIGAGLTYAWKKSFFIQASYDLTFMKKNFGAPVMESNRQHNGMASSRTDMFHQATVGVARAF